MVRSGIIAIAVVAMMGIGAGCDQGLLPADHEYSRVTVSGNVDHSLDSLGLVNPRMSLEWLDRTTRPQQALMGQRVAYRPSDRLGNDWEITFGGPMAAVKFETEDAALRIAVGKMVHYDDRADNGVLDWDCKGSQCDRVAALSDEYVVYVDRFPTCADNMGMVATRTRLGYHFFERRGKGGELVEKPLTEPLSFSLVDRLPEDSNLGDQLQEFTDALLSSWSVLRMSGC